MIEIKLRLIQQADANALFRLVSGNKAALKPYFPVSITKIKDLASTRTYIAEKIQQAAKGILYCWVIEAVENKDFMGCCIVKNIDKRVPKCELAYYVDKQYGRKGITSEALKQLVEYCFKVLKMEKIFLRIDPKNKGSKGVAINNGFEQEGYLRNDFRTGTGELIDILYFAKHADNHEF